MVGSTVLTVNPGSHPTASAGGGASAFSTYNARLANGFASPCANEGVAPMPEEYAELKQQISDLYLLSLEGELNEWESNFIEDMQEKFDKGRSFSEKEVDRIEQLYDRHCT